MSTSLSSPAEAPHDSAWWPPQWPVILVVCGGILFSATVFVILRSWEQRNIKEAFRMAAEDRTYAVKSAFDTELAMLQMLRAALTVDNQVERTEFGETLEPFLARTQDIQAVEWVPRVPDSERQQFVEAARRAGFAKFEIVEQGADGSGMTPAMGRDNYYPIYLIGPHAGNKNVRGFDLGSEPARLETLNAACDSGDATASGHIRFVQDIDALGGGFLVCLPVYDRGQTVKTTAERRKYLKGFVLGVFRPQDMIEAGLRGLQPEGIDVALYDTSDMANAQANYFHASRTTGSPSQRTTDYLLDPQNLRTTVPLGVAGKPWQIVCAATPAFFAAHRTYWPIVVLVLGIVLTFTAAGYLASSLRHALYLKEQVEEQTAAVRSTQEEVFFRLALAAQHRNDESAAHVRRIGLMSQALAEAADWFGEDVDCIRQAAPMHDIGKIGVPDAILKKHEALSPEEFELFKEHTTLGAEIFAGSHLPLLKMAKDIAWCHHERWDGKGYPRGLAEAHIPEAARIVAVVDAYDALTHGTTTQPAITEQEALLALQQEAGRQFDPQLVIAMGRIIMEMRAIAARYPDRHHANTTIPPGEENWTPTFPAVNTPPASNSPAPSA